MLYLYPQCPRKVWSSFLLLSFLLSAIAFHHIDDQRSVQILYFYKTWKPRSHFFCTSKSSFHQMILDIAIFELYQLGNYLFFRYITGFCSSLVRTSAFFWALLDMDWWRHFCLFFYYRTLKSQEITSRLYLLSGGLVGQNNRFQGNLDKISAQNRAFW